MSVFAGNPVWLTGQKWRKKQRFFGKVSAVLLAAALLALGDGLIAQMRAGSFDLDLVPGESQLISGPSPLKNPLDSDVRWRLLPPDAPVEFHLLGFFSGYWFGSGMWKARVGCRAGAAPGEYKLRVAFRGAPAQSAQTWTVRVFASAETMRAASFSCLRRWLAVNPFVAAAACGVAGIGFGVLTYFFGRLYAQALAWLGVAEIYRADNMDHSIWCLSPQALAPEPGNARMVIDWHGHLLGEARADSWHKGRLRLTMLDTAAPGPGALVCLKPPRVSQEVFNGIASLREQ